MPTVVTRTIGVGKDYANFTAAEADVVNIATSAIGGTDLVANDGAIVFEADAGDYTGNFAFFTGGALTCDPTRNVTFKPASGAGHGGEFESGANIVGSCSLQESFAVVDGLSVSPSTGGAAGIALGVNGAILRNVMAYSTNNRAFTLSRGGTASNPNVVENCVGKSDSSRAFDIRSDGQAESHWRVVNCTAMATGINQGFIVGQSSTANTIILKLVNNVVNGGTSRSYFALTGPLISVTGSNNFGPAGGSAPFPALVQGSPYPVTPTTDLDPGAGDFLVYWPSNGALVDVSGNDVWQQGVGPSVNSDVPTTDIEGVARSGATANPGAFEADGYNPPTVVTRTIGSGKDYANFTTAEADVENIATSAIGGTDLTLYNGAIVFEADAGTYSEYPVVESALTTDATRNVTFRAASGSEHLGDPASGVIVGDGTDTLNIRTEYTLIEGLHCYGRQRLNANGSVADKCIISSNNNQGGEINGDNQTVAPTYKNCVFLSNNGSISFQLHCSVDGSGRLINCTFKNKPGQTTGRSMTSHAGAGATATLEVINCISLVESNTYGESGTGTHITTGSNNFSNNSGSWPAATQGSPYPITATTSYSQALESGDYAVYMGSNGSLANVSGNDVWQQGVGPSVNSDVPTTDINGVTRSGSTANPGAFEADGYVAPTIATRTIGSGRDYIDFITAEADITNISTSAFGDPNLTVGNGAIVFEADAGTYSGLLSLGTASESDATRNVTFKAAVDPQGVFGAGPILTQGTTACVYASEDNVEFNGIELKAEPGTNVTGFRFQNAGKKGIRIKNCLWTGSADSGSLMGTFIFSPYGSGGSLQPHIIENCVSRGGIQISADSADSHFRVRNCTLLYDPSLTVDNNQRAFILYTSTGRTHSLQILNCWTEFGRPYSHSGAGLLLLTGSNNFGVSGGNAFPAAIQGSPYPITPTASYSQALESGDYAVFMGATGALANVSGNDVWQQGVGPGSNSDVPTTDILGNTRSGNTANPGAFELDGYVAHTTVTRTIGSGRDYANFTAAEADVNNISTSAFGSSDLCRGNGAIIFEVDAGEYDESQSSVYFQSTGEKDQTRNVTYRVASGEGHGGILNAGPRLRCPTGVMDDFTILDGIVLHDLVAGDHSIFNNAVGVMYRNCLAKNPDGNTVWGINAGGTQLFPGTWENCVAFGTTGTGQRLWQLATYSGDTYAKLINCTGVAEDQMGFFTAGSTANVFEVEVTNCLILGTGQVWAGNPTDPGRTLTGSNNFGGSTAPFPAALQGSPYPVTASKSYDPGSGDFALYVGSTGELLNSPNNDVVGQGVGPTANEDVPTTDIKGNTRSGATANPGAFELLNTTKTVTRTIGVGQNYETFRDAVNDLENIATSAIGNTNILDYNGAIVFNIVSGQYTDSTDLYIDTSLVTDRTRNVTFKAADGHEHGGKLNAGVIYSIAGGTYAFRIRDSHVVLQDIHIKQNLAVNKQGIELYPGNGNEAREGGHINRVIVTIQGLAAGVHLDRTGWGTAEDPLLITNCYFMNGRLNIFAQNTNSETSDNHVKIINCTSNSRGGHNGYMVYPYAGTGQTLNLTMTNNVVLPNFSQNDGRNMDNSEGAGTLNWYGINNYAVGHSMDADDTFPVAQRGSIYPITPIRNTYNTLSASGDEVVVSFGNGQLVNVPGNAIWNLGIGPDSDSDVPTVDIGGNPRTGTATNPGAYNTDLVIPSTKTVIEKSVDAGGDGQYTTPALAEADMRNIMVSATGSNDMFEANAQLDISIGGGAYSPFDIAYDRESQANLYSGPENLITFSALNLNDRPRFFGTDIGIRSDFLVVDGFDSDGGVTQNAIKFFTGGTGVKVSRSTLKSGGIPAYVAVNGNRGTEEYPVVFENCEFKNTGTARTECIYAGGGSNDHYLTVINCQANADDCTTQLTDAFIRLTSVKNGKLTLINNLNLRNGSSDIAIGTLYAGGNFSLSGSNNVGVADAAFLAKFETFGLGNIQASATTSLFPPINIPHSIYEASSNKLVDSTRNDAWKQGIGPSLNSEIDVFDIEGRTRAVYDGLTLTGYDRVNPGAYEVDTDFWTPPTAPATGPTDGPGAFPDLPLQVNFAGDSSSLNTTWTEKDGESRSRRYPTREGDVVKKIFKMSQAKSNISFIYKESLRSMISSFNDIGYFNSEDEFVDIRCIHGNAERTIAKLKQENNIILPILSVSQTISDNDDQRRRYESILVHEKYWDEDKHRAVRVVSLAPRPVNIKYQLNIWCKYMADMDQVLEQIRLKFNPEMDIPTTYSTLAKASIDSEEAVGSMSAKDKEDRVIKKTLNITLRTYIPSPKFVITSTGEIEELNIIKD